MKATILILSSLLTICLLMTSVQAYSFNIIRSGNWIIQVDTLVEKIPMNIQPKHYSQCLDQKSPIPTIPDAGKLCSITRHEINVAEVRWELQCQVNDGIRTGAGYVKYNGNLMQGQLQMTINHPNFKKPHHLQYRLKGRRTGPCQHQ